RQPALRARSPVKFFITLPCAYLNTTAMTWTAVRLYSNGVFCVWENVGRNTYNDLAMISGKILKYHQWPDRLIRFAKQAAEQLEAQGLERDAVLAQLDAVRAQPLEHLQHPLLAELARECLRQNPPPSTAQSESLRERPLQYRVWG